MCNLHGHDEGGDIHDLWTRFLQRLHHQRHPRAAEMPNLPGETVSEQCSPHIPSRSKFLTATDCTDISTEFIAWFRMITL